MTNLALRRFVSGYWPLIGASLLFVILFAVDQLWFRPTARRHAAAIKAAAELGMPLDPDQMPRLIPPRLFAMLGDNAMPAAVAQDAANSGTLTAQFLGELSQVLVARGIQIVTTEPGPITQDDQQVVVRAHVRLRCRYPEFVLMLDDLARDRRVFGVERFVLTPDPSGAITGELWASKLILKTGGKT